MKTEEQVRKACANLDHAFDYEDGSNESDVAWAVRLAFAWVLDESISQPDLEKYLWMEQGDLLK